MSSTPTASLESIVLAFESAHGSSNDVRVVDFAPQPHQPDYEDVIVELIRVDLERRRQRGETPSLDDYRTEFGQVLSVPQHLSDVAFEDYRLRRQAGEDVTRSEYAAKYGVDTSSWIVEPVTESPADETRRLSTVANLDSLMVDAQRLADTVQVMPAAGAWFGEFELVEQLGEGSFGCVFLARQKGLAQRPVVLKLSAHLWVESQHLANLQHSNIVPIYSLHRHGGLQGVCMPYLGRDTLGSVIRTLNRNRRVPTSGADFSHACPGEDCQSWPSDHGVRAEREELLQLPYVDLCLRLAAEVAEGLSHAHQRGIVHCDLKPDNVLICDDGRAMLLDFNLSSEMITGNRAATVVGGTLPYMAPEHLEAVESGGRIGPECDLYSLGVILFEMLTLKPPFPIRRGPVLLCLCQMINDRRKGPPSVRSQNPNVPVCVDSIIQKCLHPQPESRYQSAGHLADDLRRQLTNRPLVHADNRSYRELAQKWFRRHPRIASGSSVFAICSVVVVLLLALWLLRGRQLQRLEARQEFSGLAAAVSGLRIPLTAPGADSVTLQAGITAAEGELGRRGIGKSDRWRLQPDYRLLDEGRKRILEQHLQELAYLVAQGKTQIGLSRPLPEARRELMEQALAFNELAASLLPGEEPPKALLVQRSRLFDLLGKPEMAVRTKSGALRAPSQGAASRFLDGAELLYKGNFDEAEALYTDLLSVASTDVSVWFALAHAKVGLGKLSEADICLTTGISLAPDSYVLWFYRGLLRLEQRQYVLAEADFQQTLNLKPGLPAGLVNRALARSAQGRIAEAENDLSLALKNGATQTRIYFLRSRLRDQLGDESGAATDWERGLALQPEDEESWLARGVARLTEDPEQALRDFEQAYALNPGSRSAAQNIVHVLSESIGQTDAAIAALDSLVAKWPRDLDLRAGRGVLRARQGDHELALQDSDSVLSENPTPKQQYQVGCIYALVSEGDDEMVAAAIDHLRQAFRRELKWYRVAKDDKDLAALRGNARFDRLLEAAALIDQRTVVDGRGE